MLPGTVQQPRPPLIIAANGEHGMRLAAHYGEGWVTLGRSSNKDEVCFDVVASQMAQLDKISAETGRNPMEIDRVLLHGFSDERPLDSLGAFVDWAGRYQELGITEIVIHWPEPNSPFEADMRIFEEIATEGLKQL
jgi:hypothetical protein